MKKKLFFILCAVFLFAAQGWGQTWNLTPTMTARLDSAGVMTISTTLDAEAMPDFNISSFGGFWIWYAPYSSYQNNIYSVVIGDKVTVIGRDAFYSCNSLTAVSIPTSVIEIGNEAFYKCNSLTSINIPNSVTTIGNSAFGNCTGLTSIIIPNSITTIEQAAFSSTGLTSVIIPNSVTTLGSWAFQLCNNLKDVTVEWLTPLSIDEVFYHTNTAAATLHVPADTKARYAADPVWGLFGTIDDGTTSNCNTLIASGTFGENNALSWSLCEDGVLTISGQGVMPDYGPGTTPWFGYKDNIRSIVVEEGIEVIGQYAFAHLSNVVSIYIPASVRSTNFASLYNLSGLQEINISPDNVYYSSLDGVGYNKNRTRIDVYPAKKSGNTFTIPASVQEIGIYAFNNCSNLQTINIPSSVTQIGGRAFNNCVNLQTVNIPSGVTQIGDYTFNYCYNLKTINIPSGVTQIGILAFNECKSLESINVEKGNTVFSSPGGVLIKWNTDLIRYPMKKSGTSYVIPDGIVTIIQYAFDGCLLSSVSIPASVQNMQKGIFESCISLQTVVVSWETPLNVDVSIFGGVDLSKATLHVPVGTKARYEAADVWKDFGTIKEITVVTDETQAAGADGKGSVSLSLSIPSDATLTGSFDIQFPTGMTLNKDLTVLSSGLSGLTITAKENNTWQIQIGNGGLKSATAVEYRKIIDVAYTVDKTVPQGEYQAMITNLDFSLSDETTIQEELLPVSITVKTLTGIPCLQEETFAYLSAGTLYIQSPVAETVSIYSTSGVLLYNYQKPAGKATFPVNQLNGVVLIVKGSSGWVKKVIRN